MAEQKVGVKLGVTGDKKVEDAFKKVGKSADGFNKQAGSLSGTLKKLAGAAVGLFAFKKIADFMGSATKAAGIQETMEARLAGSLRTATGATKEQIKELIAYAGELQKTTMYADEQIVSGMGILSTFKLTAEQLKESTKRMVDMAAGTERATGEQQDLTTIAMALGRALVMGVGALTRYGVVMSETEKAAIGLATGNEKLMLILEALDKNYKGIAEAMAKTYTGQLRIFEHAWGDLKEEIGFGLLPVMSSTIKAFTETTAVMDKGSSVALVLYDSLGFVAKVGVGLVNGFKKLTIAMENLYISAEIGAEKLKGLIPGIKANKVYILELQKVLLENDKAYKDLTIEMGQFLLELDKQKEDVKEGRRSWEDMLDTLKGGAIIIDEAGDAAAEMAEKIKSAFSSLSKTIISQIQTQIESVRDLEKELAGLSENTDEQLKVAEDRYGDNLKSMARMAQERINQIDKQIADTRKAMSRGWRGEVSELETEKEKQKAIIARIGGEIIDIQAEAKKDELIVLQEAHEKELAEIKEQAKKRELEIKKEILEKKVAVTRGAIEVKTPGFFEEAAKVEAGLKPWEVSPYQNIFNFSFEGEVADRDALIKAVIEAVNRAAELKQFAKE